MISKISNMLMTVIIIVVVFIAGALLLPRAFGYTNFGVLSGSMEPVFHVGSVVYVKAVEPEEIKVGNAITFHLEGEGSLVATHRAIAIDKGARTFTTKGDANQVSDGEPVSFDQLIGRADFSIPYLGYLAVFIQTKQGIVAGIGVIIFMIFLSLLGDMTKKEDEKNMVRVESKEE